MSQNERPSQDLVMSGILALLAAQREDMTQNDQKPEERRKTEIILSDAGFSPAQIGQILGKKANTISKSISRARQGGKAKEDESNG